MKFLLRYLLAAQSGLALVALPAAAQAPQTDSAVAAANGNLLALVRRDYQYVADHTDPLFLRRTRASFDSALHTDSSRATLNMLFGVDSARQLQQWTDAQYVARLLQFWVGASHLDDQFSGVRALETPGGVFRSGDTVLVVYRWTYGDKSQGPYFVEPMVRCPIGWCSQMAANFSSILTILRGSPKRP